jgi:hypothetical protein
MDTKYARACFVLFAFCSSLDFALGSEMLWLDLIEWMVALYSPISQLKLLNFYSFSCAHKPFVLNSESVCLSDSAVCSSSCVRGPYEAEM